MSDPDNQSLPHGANVAVKRGVNELSLHRGYFLRRLAWLGARHGPRWLLRFAPTVVGTLAAWFLPRERRAITQNLREIAATKAGSFAEHRRVLETFSNYAACLAESLALGRKEERQAHYEYRGREALAGLAPDRGVIVFTAHVGAWDVAARALRRSLARQVLLVMSPEPSRAARHWHNQLRRQSQIEVFETSPDPLSSLRLLHHLNSGGLLAAQLDRTQVGQRSIAARCGNSTLAIPEGILRLAALAQVPILTVFCRRLGFFRYRLELGGPFRLTPRASRAELNDIAQRCADELAKFVEQSPEQWFRFER